MTRIFQYQGFGVLSEWNGQVQSASAQQAMQAMAANGANSIEITPRIWTSTASSNTVMSVAAKTESDSSLIAGINNAHADGLSVILKPNISTLDGTGSSGLAPTDVAAFFASYKAEIVHLATIAQQTGVEVVAIGNEMSSLSGAQYQSYWTDIISAVRGVYHGELTYAAATDEASKVSFWSQLDTIGVNTYPPLSVSGTPTVANMVSAWSQVPTNPYWYAAFNGKSPIDFLHSLATQYGKQVLMTEAGYLSIDYGTTITGSWQTTGPMDLQMQADAYAAFLQVWTSHSGPWLQGVDFWQWDLSNVFSPTGFSPMGKPALAIIAEYFKGVGPLVAANIAALTASQISGLASIGIKTIVATDHAVGLSSTEIAALGAAGISLSEPYGTGAQTLTWNSDGSLHDIHYQVISGTTYTDYDVIYNAKGLASSATYSNGMTEGWTYNADSSLHEIVDNGITGQKWTSSDTVYGSAGTPVSETWTNGTTLVQTETWNADGSVHDVHYYGVTGQAYADFDVVYGANGKPSAASYSNGMLETWSYNGDGSLHEVAYSGITGQNWTSTDTIYGASGKPASETWNSGTTLVQTETWNTDGSVQDIHYYGVTGQAFTSYDIVYGANGKPATASYSNGMTETWSYNADQSLHSISYAGVANTSYTSYTAGYGSNGSSVLQEFVSTNGTENIRGVAADHLTFISTAAGETVATSTGQAFNFNFGANTNAVLSGGGNNETFVFSPGFGHQTVTDFVPNADSASQHDAIAFTSGAFSSFADLLNHATQSGSGTVITDAAGDTLLLQHVALAHLTAADFLLT